MICFVTLFAAGLPLVRDSDHSKPSVNLGLYRRHPRSNSCPTHIGFPVAFPVGVIVGEDRLLLWRGSTLIANS